MPENYEIKPNKLAFVGYAYVKIFAFSLIFFGLLYYIVNLFAGAYVVYVIALFAGFQVYTYYSLSVQYRKEKYIFIDNKIIRKSGSIFSDNQTELLVKNITHVSMRLGYVEHTILFETGDISIESAGSGGVEVSMQSVDAPEKIYVYIEKVMKNNGFRLGKERLVQQEMPSTLGVLFETFRNFVSAALLIAYIGGTARSAMPVMELVGIETSGVAAVAGLLMSAVFLIAFFRFMDLKQRVYNVYSDTITYSEGFLTKNKSFIPIENLADSSITQNLLDKIFGLYDVKISCQGSGQEILFKNMENGPKLEKNIDRLIGESRSFETPDTSGDQEISDIQLPSYAPSRAKTPRGDTAFTADYRMDTKRTLIPPLIGALPFFFIILIATTGFLRLTLLIPLMVAWIAVFAINLIKLNSTLYLVKPASMEEQYNFLSSKNLEFSNEKITGVIFKENFIDKWFGTCSIQFWSIGSSEKILFSNIAKAGGLREKIMAKFGMRPAEVLYKINSDFSVIDMLRANIFKTIFACILAASMVGAAVLSSYWFLAVPVIMALLYAAAIGYAKIYYARSKMTFLQDYIYFEKGVFFKDFYYILYDRIKNISTVKYPFSAAGSIIFDVAGEQITQSGERGIVVSNEFKINYAPGIENKDDLIDTIFCKRPGAAEIKSLEETSSQYPSKAVLVAKPDVLNSLVSLVLGSIIIFPLIALLPLTILMTIWKLKVTSYVIEPYRVLKKSGILYRKQKSIIFSKIDHINFREGFMNKMLGNGTIVINTTGSSKAEMIVANVPNFKVFFDMLKKHY